MFCLMFWTADKQLNSLSHSGDRSEQSYSPEVNGLSGWTLSAAGVLSTAPLLWALSGGSV